MNTRTPEQSQRPQPPRAEAMPSGPRPTQSMENPFLNDEEHTLPHIPDDKDWHYCWVRYRIGQEDDTKNMLRHMNGKLPYELVSVDMLPKPIQTTFGMLKISQGQHSGYIGISDVILARTPMELYRKYYEATQIRADRMNEALSDEVSSKNRDRRSRMFVEEDSEAQGVRPGRAEVYN